MSDGYDFEQDMERYDYQRPLEDYEYWCWENRTWWDKLVDYIRRFI